VFYPINNLLEQYDTLEKLVWEGNNLGYVLEERGQGMPHFLDHLRAALEYERCDRLDYALDIPQNLRCYDFLPDDVEMIEYGKRASDMILTKYGHVRRNEEPFYYEFSQQPTRPEISM